MHEEDLEPVDLIRTSGVVLRLGRMMLSAGAGSYRVKNSMRRTALALGLDRHEAHVTLTEITATSHRGPIFRTEVAEQRAIGVNADRLDRLASFVAGTRPELSVDEVEAELDRIEERPPLYGPAVTAGAVALACAAFAFLNNGGQLECAAVFVAAGLGQALRGLLQRRHLNQFAVTALAAAVACSLYALVVLGLERLDLADPSQEAGYISAVLFLVPGFPLVTAVLDLVRLDISAGISRVVYTAMILLSTGMSVWVIAMVAGMESAPAQAHVQGVLLVVLQLLASAVAAGGFALLFNTPARVALISAGIGGIANVGRLVLIHAGMAGQAATLLAAVAVGLLAAAVVARTNLSRSRSPCPPW